ncbi:MAG: hypothetical protein LBN39_10070 [Planctomycetaceae bacterium]|nr:hypothetical protein [Planctomycetaceae bacterium]
MTTVSLPNREILTTANTMKPLRLFIFSVVLVLIACQFADAARLRIFRRNAGAEPAAEKSITPAEARAQLEILCGQVQQDYRKISADGLTAAKKQLTGAVADLSKVLNTDPNQEAAKDWQETFRIADLQRELQNDKPNAELLQSVWDSLNSGKKGVRWTVFDGFRKSLRRYQTVERLLKDNNYDAQIAAVCGGVVKYVDEYAKDPAYAYPLSNAVNWLEDVAVIEPRTQRIAGLLRTAFSGENVHVKIGANFIAAAFRETAEEALDIDEVINGTHLAGAGTVKRTSTARLGNSKKGAEIITVVEAELHSTAHGSHPPVAFDSETTGTMRGEKSIFLTDSIFKTAPAKTRADLNTVLSNIQINGCCLVKAVAKSQINSQQEESKAEAENRAAKRMSSRIDEIIDPQIAELNDNYQKKFRELLVQNGLFPRVWKLSSTEEFVVVDALVADCSQPSAVMCPSAQTAGTVTFQVHQSALNNAAAVALAGRSVDEENSEDFKKRLESLQKFLKLPEDKDSKPVKLTFASKNPVEVRFEGGRIQLLVRLDSIQVGSDKDRAYTIEAEYQIVSANGKTVLKQTKLEALPTGFDKKKGQLNAFQLGIQNGIIRRLNLKDKDGKAVNEITLGGIELGGRWQDKGKLIPVQLSAVDGWLTFGADWK